MSEAKYPGDMYGFYRSLQSNQNLIIISCPFLAYLQSPPSVTVAMLLPRIPVFRHSSRWKSYVNWRPNDVATAVVDSWGFSMISRVYNIRYMALLFLWIKPSATFRQSLEMQHSSFSHIMTPASSISSS